MFFFVVKTKAQLLNNQEVISNKIEFSTSDFHAKLSGATTKFSSLTTFHGSTYFVYCDKSRRPVIGKINPSGAVETMYLDKEEITPYFVQDDEHHVFSIGVDKKGYIHVVGDAHGNLFGNKTDLLPSRFQGASYLHWVSNIPQNIDSFEFIGLNKKRIIPGYAFSYFSFHNDMNGVLYAQYRSRIHHVNLPPGSNGWGMSKYNEATKMWESLGVVPESTNATGVYPAVIWEQSGHFNEADPSTSFYQGFTGDVNFDFNNRMHIAATINGDSNVVQDTHVIYAYSDDSGKRFKRPGGEFIEKLPIRAIEGIQQGSIVDSVENDAFDGIYSSASVVFDMNGIPAVSFLPLEDKYKISTNDHDHFRYWNTITSTWSDLKLSPQKSQTASEHLLDCNGIITFAGARIWNAEIYRTTAFDKKGYTTFTLPNEFKALNRSGVDERGIREGNVLRWMVNTDESLMIVSSKFEPISLSPLVNGWKQNKLGSVNDGKVGIYNNILQVKSSGIGLLSNGTLDLQFINKPLEGNGGTEVRIINVDYANGAFGGLMLSEDTSGSGNFYSVIIDYEGLKAWSNTGKGGNVHFKSIEDNEPSEWLKIERFGSTVNAFNSNNGLDWFLFDSIQIDLPNTINVGLISGSGGNWPGTTRADQLKTFKEDELSVDEHNFVKKIKVYPTVSHSFINVEFPITNNIIDELLIYDIVGNKISSCTQQQISENSIKIDISALETGIYFIGVPGKFFKKFIKTN